MTHAYKTIKGLSPEQRNFAIDFMRETFIPTVSINEKHSAYGLKQKFSRRHFYLTSEQFIQVMVQAGFIAKNLPDGNARFNISQRSPYFER